ncbi:hypothetical protein P171DRAFT_521981 [Karstenula rhodostoma CBS 690.94]|uniref:Uncharacterized protein n=1 Tax=Karstenula rhodostoma CBS 690.94 TaxID=1392251 RepID=A0A9P4UAU4_9PLEO|nr:hypothetical protein P171DRAFT_521981 [Karstenula rhodostoma CBS 690.94]
MDPLSVIGSLAAAVGFVSSLSTQRLYSDTGVVDWSKIHGQFITVFDITSDSDHPPVALVQTGLQTSHQLSDLPSPTADSCRVYLVHNAKDDEVFKAHVRQLIPGSFEAFYNGETRLNASPLNRRLKDDHMPWWQGGFCTFGFIPRSQEIFEGMIRCRLRLRCVWREDYMLCFICCEVESANYNIMLRNQCTEMAAAMFGEISQLSSSFRCLQTSFVKNHVNRTNRTMQQRMMILRLCYAVLIKNADFLSKTERLYRKSLRNLVNPGQKKITRAFLSMVAQDSYFWELVQQDMTVFLTSLDSFLASLQLVKGLSDPVEFQELIIEIQGQSMILERKVSSTTTRLENRLRFLEISRSVHESGRVKLLSLLAIIFLPLSLASSILSMQTRFVDLHYLLYDFFGVIFLLGTMTFILLGILVLIQWGYGKLFNWMENRSRSPLSSLIPAGKLASLVAMSAFLVPWALTVASFLVGMIHNVGLGLKVLGYGFGGITVLFIAILLMYWLTHR